MAQRDRILRVLVSKFGTDWFKPSEAMAVLDGKIAVGSDYGCSLIETTRTLQTKAIRRYLQSLVGNTCRIMFNSNPNGRIGTMRSHGLPEDTTLIFSSRGKYRLNLPSVMKFLRYNVISHYSAWKLKIRAITPYIYDGGRNCGFYLAIDNNDNTDIANNRNAIFGYDNFTDGEHTVRTATESEVLEECKKVVPNGYYMLIKHSFERL